MKRTRFTEVQIFNILKEFDAGKNIQDIAREQGISKATIYNWKAKYGGMEMNELKRIKELEDENRKLKQMYADLALDNKMLKDVYQASCVYGARKRVFIYNSFNQASLRKMHTSSVLMGALGRMYLMHTYSNRWPRLESWQTSG